jgi:hypothetical protein
MQMESSIFAEEVMTGMTLPAIECWSTENTLQEISQCLMAK